MTVTYNSEAYFEAIEARRSYYALTAKSSIPPAQIQALLERALEASPTSYNMQHLRAVVITGKHHQALWTAIRDQKLSEIPEDRQEQIVGRFAGFLAAYGSVLFFEDQEVLKQWGEKMPFAAKAFTSFSSHASGMLHHVVWTALEKEGLGGNLQHNGEGDDTVQQIVRKQLGLPETWTNTAILNFGVPAAAPGEKAIVPGKERVKVIFDEDLE